MDATHYRTSGVRRVLLRIQCLCYTCGQERGEKAVEIGQTESLTKKERDRDSRLRKTYGISLADHNRILVAQGGCCAICGRPASDFKHGLNCDHEHFKVTAHRDSEKRWCATTVLKNGTIFSITANTKIEAVQAVKKVAMPHAVRGLLCPGRHGPRCCNRNLGRIDDPIWLRKAADYLENPPAKREFPP